MSFKSFSLSLSLPSFAGQLTLGWASLNGSARPTFPHRFLVDLIGSFFSLPIFFYSRKCVSGCILFPFHWRNSIGFSVSYRQLFMCMCVCECVSCDWIVIFYNLICSGLDILSNDSFLFFNISGAAGGRQLDKPSNFLYWFQDDIQPTFPVDIDGLSPTGLFFLYSCVSSNTPIGAATGQNLILYDRMVFSIFSVYLVHKELRGKSCVRFCPYVYRPCYGITLSYPIHSIWFTTLPETSRI